MAPNNSIVIRPMTGAAAVLDRLTQPLYEAPETEIRGLDPAQWASPLQPIKPIGGPNAEPQAFQLWAGQNLIYTPRPDADLSAADLKAFASYPLARLCIENIKDIVCEAPWEIQLKSQPGETKAQAAKRAKGNEDLLKLNRFFEHPDREHFWDEWLRLVIEDLLVGDYVSILIRKTFGGQLVETPPIRGEMITRYVDANGWTPLAPDPAYAQLWWGIPRVDLSTDQLVYKPRNIVPRNTMASQLYGMSQTEQLAPEIEIGIQRLAFVLAYYTEGSVPGVVQVVPKGTPPDKIEEAMKWMNSELAGNLAKRRQWRLVQGFNEPGKADQIEFTKEALLSDPYDEKHMRTLAFGYGVSPQRLMKQMNRASSEQADDAAEVEGVRPILGYVRNLVNEIIQRRAGYTEFELKIAPQDEPDAQKQAETLTTYVKSSVLRPNEAREKLGEDPDPAPAANELGVVTGTGFVTLSQQQELHEAALETQAATAEAQRNPKPAVGAPQGDGKAGAAGESSGGAKKEPTSGDDTAKLMKGLLHVVRNHELRKTKKVQPHGVVKAKIHPGRLTTESIVAKHELERVAQNRLRRMGRIATRVLRKRVGIATKASADENAALQEILDELSAEWLALAEEARGPIEDASTSGAELGTLQLDITDDDLIAKVNAQASAWAADRAAELVGMKRTSNGDLVANPDAKWAITDTTRDKLREIIADVFEMEAPTLADIEQRIIDAGIFDDQRATMIARTEVARAQSQANLMSWRESGLVLKVSWQVSADHEIDDICDDNEDESPYELDSIPEHPAHPNCECVITLEQLKGEPDGSEE